MRYYEIAEARCFSSSRFVQSLWYANTPFVEHRRERIVPTGCAHIVVSLSRDFLTDCPEGRPERRTPPALMVGQRSVYEIIATADLVDLAGVIFNPAAVPAFVADRADLVSNRNLPLDQIWPGYTDHLRSRMLEGSSPGSAASYSRGLLDGPPYDETRTSRLGATSGCAVRVRAVRTGLEPVLYCQDRAAHRLERTPILPAFSRAGWIPTQGVVSAAALSTRSAAPERRRGISVG